MADFVQGLDPSKLVLVGTIMSFAISPFTSPSYNLPIFLFGIYAQETSEATQSMKTFTGLLGVSALFDLIFMTQYEQSTMVKVILILVMLLKAPTFLAFGLALRQRGAQFSGLSNNVGGQTVWSMPGGFTGFGAGQRDGYEAVDEPNLSKPTPAAPVNAGPPASGAYQSV